MNVLKQGRTDVSSNAKILEQRDKTKKNKRYLINFASQLAVLWILNAFYVIGSDISTSLLHKETKLSLS